MGLLHPDKAEKLHSAFRQVHLALLRSRGLTPPTRHSNKPGRENPSSARAAGC